MDLQKFRTHFNGMDTFSVANDIMLTKLEEGYAEVQLEFTARASNYMGSAHGGALYTMADVAAGTSLVYTGRRCVTLDSSMSYLNSVNSGTITATAKVIRAGGRIAVCEIHITDDQETLLCQGMITMYITQAKIELDF